MTLDWSRTLRTADTLPAAPGAVTWRTFLRGFALELGARATPEAAAVLLRGIGGHMARMLALPPVASMEALQLEMNGVLAEIGWGRVQLTLDEVQRCVVLSHHGLPSVGSAGDPAGSWLAPVLVGLYETWMAQQPGNDDTFYARLHDIGDVVILHYGRA